MALRRAAADDTGQHAPHHARGVRALVGELLGREVVGPASRDLQRAELGAALVDQRADEVEVEALQREIERVGHERVAGVRAAAERLAQDLDGQGEDVAQVFLAEVGGDLALFGGDHDAFVLGVFESF